MFKFLWIFVWLPLTIDAVDATFVGSFIPDVVDATDDVMEDLVVFMTIDCVVILADCIWLLSPIKTQCNQCLISKRHSYSLYIHLYCIVGNKMYLQNLQNFLHDVVAKSCRDGSVQREAGKWTQSTVSSQGGESIKTDMAINHRNIGLFEGINVLTQHTCTISTATSTIPNGPCPEHPKTSVEVVLAISSSVYTICNIQSTQWWAINIQQHRHHQCLESLVVPFNSLVTYSYKISPKQSLNKMKVLLVFLFAVFLLVKVGMYTVLEIVIKE